MYGPIGQEIFSCSLFASTDRCNITCGVPGCSPQINLGLSVSHWHSIHCLLMRLQYYFKTFADMSSASAKPELNCETTA